MYTSLRDPSSTPEPRSRRSIAQQFSEATDEVQVSALIELGLILFVITMVFQLLAKRGSTG